MCNMQNGDTCVGYWKGGGAIRQRDIAEKGLNPDSFGRVSRAGYQRIRIQVVHLNCALADAVRRAARRFAGSMSMELHKVLHNQK